MEISDSLKNKVRKYKVRITYTNSHGKRKYRKACTIQNEIKKRVKKKKTKFGVVSKSPDGHYREQEPASGLKIDINDNTRWIWLPVKWTHCPVCGMYHSNREIPASFWKRDWSSSPSPSNVKTGVILVKGGKLLMTQSYHDKFGFPKGSVDKGENIYQAAVRELKEETGVSLNVNSLKGVSPMNIVSGGNVYKMFVYKVPLNFKLTSFPEDDAEITSFGWVDIRFVEKLKLSRAMRSVFEAYKKFYLSKPSLSWRKR